ncbi:putative tripeptidyl-peptidase II [Dioscorea sansibarensis]
MQPDIAAPGVDILAGWSLILSSDVPAGKKPTGFNLLSGTSMSWPHVTGVAANIKSWNSIWSPAGTRSAIMTTSILMNNDKAQSTTGSGSATTPYDFGAGEVNPTTALQPGDAGPQDYLLLLCNYGYDTVKIKHISATTLVGFKCPQNSSKDLISGRNYPSIAVSSQR